MGWNAAGNLGDFYPTALDDRTPGVVVHAAVANSILTGYVVVPAPPWTGVIATLVLGLLAALGATRVGPRLSFLFALLLALLYAGFNMLVLFDRLHVAAAFVTPITSTFLAWGMSTAVRAVRDQRDKAQLRRQFGARVSPQLFEYLVEHPGVVDLAGEEREVTCFFSDLAGFTELSEALTSRRTVGLLNRYMAAMNEVLTQHDAYVNKFLGDGIMAIWGAFATDTPHAERACRAALGCAARLTELAKDPDLAELSMRIGIATGVVTIGDCGAPPDLRDYTVIGDSANLAARLESANKQFGTKILVNARTRELASDQIISRPLGTITVVGQKKPTDVHEVLALAGGRDRRAKRTPGRHRARRHRFPRPGVRRLTRGVEQAAPVAPRGPLRRRDRANEGHPAGRVRRRTPPVEQVERRPPRTDAKKKPQRAQSTQRKKGNEDERTP